MHESIVAAERNELAKIHAIADNYRNEFNTDVDALANAKSYKTSPHNVNEILRLAAMQVSSFNLPADYTFKCKSLKAMAFPCTTETIFDGTGAKGFDVRSSATSVEEESHFGKAG